jgi:hypothetical protein
MLLKVGKPNKKSIKLLVVKLKIKNCAIHIYFVGTEIQQLLKKRNKALNY